MRALASTLVTCWRRKQAKVRDQVLDGLGKSLHRLRPLPKASLRVHLGYDEIPLVVR